MKKLLIPLLCSLVAAWSCSLDSSYYAENVRDFVTVKENRLFNDNGVEYIITEKSSTSIPTLEEDKRYYMVFDILNQNLEIRLHSLTPTKIVPTRALPEETENLGQDPVDIQFSKIGRDYLDLGISYQVAANSDYAHQIEFYYTLDNANSQLNLHLYHKGNNENLVYMEEKDLKVQSAIFSISRAAWQNVNEITLSCDVLVKDGATNEYKIVRRTY